MQKSTILIAGGSGLIGSRLAEMLRAAGHTVRLLSRSPKGDGQYYWNPSLGEIDAQALQHVDAIVNLAGAGIAGKRWTTARKRELIDSRVQSAALLQREIAQMQERPKVYLSVSGVGYYGNSGETRMYEDTPPVDQGFMVDCCRQWESAADQLATLGLRILKFRIGVVLAKEGGALAEIIKPLRFGLGAYFGSGKAWWSWVHLDDVCQAFVWGLENQQVEGVYNLVSPSPVRGKDLVKATAKAMRQPAVFLPAPTIVLQLLFGEMAAVILNSNLVSSDKLIQAGFKFQWTPIDAALHDIFAP